MLINDLIKGNKKFREVSFPKYEGDLKEFWHFGQYVNEEDKAKYNYPENVDVKEVAEFNKYGEETYKQLEKTGIYVLRALGLSDELAHSSIRFSFGKYTTEEDIDQVLEVTKAAVQKLRDLSPLWDMYKDGIDLSTVEWAEH